MLGLYFSPVSTLWLAVATAVLSVAFIKIKAFVAKLFRVAFGKSDAAIQVLLRAFVALSPALRLLVAADLEHHVPGMPKMQPERKIVNHVGSTSGAEHEQEVFYTEDVPLSLSAPQESPKVRSCLFLES